VSHIAGSGACSGATPYVVRAFGDKHASSSAEMHSRAVSPYGVGADAKGGRMSPEEIVEAFITAFTNGEPAKAAEFAADDIVYDNIGLGSTSFESIVPTINGAQAMVEYLAPLQDVEWVIHRQFSSGNLVINERRDKMTFGGTQVDLLVLGVFEVVDGKITMWRDYCDMATITGQMSGS
jgi:limonene-1,2-epoxide hydrolase